MSFIRLKSLWYELTGRCLFCLEDKGVEVELGRTWIICSYERHFHIPKGWKKYEGVDYGLERHSKPPKNHKELSGLIRNIRKH